MVMLMLTSDLWTLRQMVSHFSSLCLLALCCFCGAQPSSPWEEIPWEVVEQHLKATVFPGDCRGTKNGKSKTGKISLKLSFCWHWDPDRELVPCLLLCSNMDTRLEKVRATKKVTTIPTEVSQ